ncbi:MAG TPA: HYR domain-containing protein [Saprospiraceae bacterium]|nr:HYR domain-containing protein [Saprospiraceae bacterium]
MRLFTLLLLTAFVQILHAGNHFALIHWDSDSLPVITCPGNVTLSTDPFNCVVPHTYEVVVSGNGPLTLVQTTGLPSGGLFPVGLVTNSFVVTDSAGNAASCFFTVKVFDYNPPVMVCDQAVTVAIGVGDDLNDCYEAGNGQFGGAVWLKADVFDNGTYDECSDFILTIRRVAPYSAVINGLNQVNGHPPCNDPFPDFPSEFERAISEQDSIKFYCGEAGSTQTVALRAYQWNEDGTPSLDANGGLIYNECYVTVTVEDKIKPVCTPPATVSVSCEQFDPSLLSYGAPSTIDNCCVDGVTFTANYNQFDTVCNKGTLTRTFRVTDCSGNFSTCTQRIIVSYEQDYYIKFPNDVIATNCNSTGIYGEPLFFGEDCELMGVSYADEIIDVVPDACYRIERTWTVINWCTYNPNAPLTLVPNPTPNPVANNPVNLPGPTVSACGTQPPWQSTIVKISPVDTAATDYCTFWSANANGYRYKQIIKILDSADPVFEPCPNTGLVFEDSSFNHPFYWNGVFNPSLPSQDLTETSTMLSVTGTDACSGSNVGFNYLLYLDLDADGVMESVINSMNPPPADTIYYNNHLSPNFIGGTPRPFDNRPVPQTQKWQFRMAQSTLGATRTASVRWVSAENPAGIVPELPVGTHKIRWFLTDGCGNQGVCEYTFTVEAGEVSAVKSMPEEMLSIRLEPNPVTDQARLSVYLPEKAHTRLSVFSADGQLVQQETATHDAGTQLFTLDAKSWGASGVYLVRIEAGARVGWCKVVRI